MILSMFSLSVNDIIYKYFSFHFPVWESIFFRALSGCVISIFLVLYFGIDKLNQYPTYNRGNDTNRLCFSRVWDGRMNE